jgi:hypothetical protein
VVKKRKIAAVAIPDDHDDVEENDEDVVDSEEPAGKKKKTKKRPAWSFTLPESADMDISSDDKIIRPTTICVGSGLFVSSVQMKGNTGGRQYSYPALCITKRTNNDPDKDFTINVNFRLVPKIVEALNKLTETKTQLLW